MKHGYIIIIYITYSNLISWKAVIVESGEATELLGEEMQTLGNFLGK